MTTGNLDAESARPSTPTAVTREHLAKPARPIWRTVSLVLGPRGVRWMLGGVAGSLALAFVELAIARVIQLFLKSLGILAVDVEPSSLLGGLGESPRSLAVLLILIAIVRAVAQFFGGSSSTVAMEMINARLRRLAIFEMLLHSSERYVPASEINARMGEYFVRASHFAYAAAQVAVQFVQSCALALIMFYVGIRESLLAMAGLLVIGLAVTRINRMNRGVAKQIPVELEALSRGIERIARNAFLVRALRTQHVEHVRFARSVDAYAKHSIHSGYLGNGATVLPPFAGILLIVLIVAISKGVFATRGLVLLSFLYLFTRFVQALSAATSHLSVCNQYWAQFRGSVQYLERFTDADIEMAMRDVEPSVRVSAPVDAAESVVLAASIGAAPSIRLHGLSFRYDGADTAVLTDLDIEVKQASQLAIVGPSGCGKSTLLGLVMGLLTPSSGTVQIGGRDPREYFKDGSQRIGYVGAEAFLIAGTIRDNLCYGLRREAADGDLLAALDYARLRTTVEGLPGGLNYLIGEDGAGLSAGQKQRLCLARALLAKPHLLVLDEASANLDEATEMEIASSLQGLKGETTVVIVSHRPGILKYVDQTIQLGPVVQSLQASAS
jgi:ABC-type multidrug transport system fused ATPase/permease subunit